MSGREKSGCGTQAAAGGEGSASPACPINATRPHIRHPGVQPPLHCEIRTCEMFRNRTMTQPCTSLLHAWVQPHCARGLAQASWRVP